MDARLRVLSDNLSNGVVYQMISNREGTATQFTYVSEPVRHVFGVAAEDVLADANTIYSRVLPEDAPILAAKEAECQEKLQALQTEFRFIHSSGEIRWLRVTSSPRVLSDDWVAWDGFGIDITDGVRLRERDRFNIEFRTLVAELSAQFVRVKDKGEFDQAVDQALASLGEMFGVDRSYLFRFSPDLDLIDNTHEWCAPGISTEKEHEQNLPTAELP